jgi:Mn-dependent DtxR family transcriptional regulator
MLGVRRVTITPVARKLQETGLIRYIRGRITILDRLGLETASCECYHRTKAIYDGLLEHYSVPSAKKRQPKTE